MKTIVTFAAAIAIIAGPALAAQKAGPNLPLLQAMPQMTIVAKPKPKPKKQEPYLIIRMNDAMITSY